MINQDLWDCILSLHHELTHWGRVTHICVSKLTIIGSDNGLSPGRRQAIIWTSDEILLIGALKTNFSETLIKIQTFSFWKNRLKMPSANWRPFCLGLNELKEANQFNSYKLTTPISNGDWYNWKYYARHGNSNHRQLDCLVNSLFGLSYKTSKLYITDTLWGETTNDQWISLTNGQ